MDHTLEYNGTKLEQQVTFEAAGKEHLLEAYYPSDELMDAVNLAIQLNRPLLVMGEPGCGKTRLAEAVAYELHGEDMHQHYFRWDIKSTSKAKDGIYKYDALKRLYHANLKTKDSQDVGNIWKYITPGKLQKAFTQPKNTKNGAPNILLIDEIDKANIDFPNDLLLELDERTFTIDEAEDEDQPDSETKENIEPHDDTLIFITSNQEKELPAAFLRRCLYHYIHFPEEDALKKIVRAHTQTLSDEKIAEIVTLFSSQIRESLSAGEKKPATSELIQWLRMIDHYTKIKEEKTPEAHTPAEKRLVAELEKLNTRPDSRIDLDKIPFRQILIKTPSALHTLNQKPRP